MNLTPLPSPCPRQYAGLLAQDIAMTYLQAKGYTHIASNIRIPGSEMDLLMTHGTDYVCVEVKYRSSLSQAYTDIATLVSYPKQRALMRGIRSYASANNLDIDTFRVDIVRITGSLEDPHIAHHSRLELDQRCLEQ
jgi:putative endonuclease